MLFFSPTQFNWRPYLLLDHEPNESDREVWTAVTPIIRFNIVEMHQSDRVRLQFGMHQPIPDPPTDLGRSHIKRVNNQWDHADYRTFTPEFCEMWKQRRSRLLQFPVAQLPMFPTAGYLAWYRTVTTPDMYVSDPYYLHDPRQQQYAQQPPQQYAQQPPQQYAQQPPQQRQQRRQQRQQCRQRQTSEQPDH